MTVRKRMNTSLKSPKTRWYSNKWDLKWRENHSLRHTSKDLHRCKTNRLLCSTNTWWWDNRIWQILKEMKMIFKVWSDQQHLIKWSKNVDPRRWVTHDPWIIRQVMLQEALAKLPTLCHRWANDLEWHLLRRRLRLRLYHHQFLKRKLHQNRWKRLKRWQSHRLSFQTLLARKTDFPGMPFHLQNSTRKVARSLSWSCQISTRKRFTLLRTAYVKKSVLLR